MYWFGYWPEPRPPIAADMRRWVPTPVGEDCLWCEEPIEAADLGVLIGAVIEGEPSLHPMHQECDLRSVVGSISHLEKRCSCYGGTGHDPQDVSKHEAARMVLAWIQEHGIAV